jgi:hypothetical protein
MTWDDHQSIIQQSKSWLWSKERRGRGNNWFIHWLVIKTVTM